MANLYNKYRPQCFAEVVGQAVAVKTLKNQIKNKTFSHAYLFTGTRGTGKTTCARIFARAINCQNAKDGEPCNECDSCKDLLRFASSDLTEIDAASNNGVDDIRTMIEEVSYTPMFSTYKIYIIDEVHMLSSSAFNALLKTLEEPPEYGIFILATTEINKVPATIKSRCQRFDFYRLHTEEIAAQLKKIIAAEQKTLPDRSIEEIAELGDGSMRDAISVLDKVLELKTEEEIREVLGLIDRKTILGILDAVAENDSDRLLCAINDIYFKLGDLQNLCSQLLSQMRAVLVVKNVKDFRAVLDTTEEHISALQSLAKKFTAEKLIYAVSALQQTLSVLSYSKNKRDDVEICLLKISKPELELDAKALAARISELEKQIAELKRNGVTINATAEPTKQKKQEKKKSDQKSEGNPEPPVFEPPLPYLPDEEPQPEQTPKNEQPVSENEFHEYLLWGDICKKLKQKSMLAAMELSDYAIALVKKDEIIILCTDEGTKALATDNLELIKEAFIAQKKDIGTIKAVVGKKQQFIDETKVYENLESNEFLKFE